MFQVYLARELSLLQTIPSRERYAQEENTLVREEQAEHVTLFLKWTSKHMEYKQ